MPYTPEDAEREIGEERLLSRFLDDHRDNIIAEFVEERMASYFEANPNLAQPAISAREEARKVSPISANAGLVFAMSATEIAIQDVLLKPVVIGLTHSPDLCDLLAALVDIRRKQTEEMLFGILELVGMPSLKSNVLPNGRTVWKEKLRLQELRNLVLHQGATVSSNDAGSSLLLADYLLETVYPNVRDFFTHKSSGWV